MAVNSVRHSFLCNNKVCLLGLLKACKQYTQKRIATVLPAKTVRSCFVYKVIRDLELIDHLRINPICRIGLIHK